MSLSNWRHSTKRRRVEAGPARSIRFRMGILVLLLGAVTMALFSGLLAAFAPPLAIALAVVAVVIIATVWLFTRMARKYGPGVGTTRLALWALAINFPTFVAFDRTGLTTHGLFNPQSISRIFLFLLVLGIALLLFAFHRRDNSRGAAIPKAGIFLLPVLTYCWYTFDALLVSGGTDLALAVFRAGEWLLLILLFWMAWRDLGEGGSTDAESLLKLSLPIIFFPALVNVVVFPLAPNWIYQTSEATGVSRFGALFTHPNVLAALATMGFFYIWTHWLGWKRHAMAGLMFALVLLSYSRGGLIAFAVAFGAYSVLSARSAATRFFIVATALVGTFLLVGWGEQIVGAILTFFERGHGLAKLQELSERTIVWNAAREMIAQSPWLGHGFVAGPKKLADIMAYMSTGTYFVAPHAHNEFLQAQVSGGILASALIALIHLRTFYLAVVCRSLMQTPLWAMIVTWIVTLDIYAILQPTFSLPVSTIGALHLFVLLFLEHIWRTRPARVATVKQPVVS